MIGMRNKLYKYIYLLPILYLFVSVFLARGKVQYVYLLVLALIALTIYAQYRRKIAPEAFLAQWMLVLASVGISAAVILSIEKVELLAEPGHVASCSLSPIVACSPIIASPQASAFGFPNSFIGIFGFTMIFMGALAILAGGTKLSRAWWRMLFGGVVFAAAFSSWLIYQGVFAIGKLCLYCMLVWLVSFALLWLIAAYCIQKKHLNLGKKLNNLLGYKYELITTTFVLIFMIIAYRWWDYWISLF